MVVYTRGYDGVLQGLRTETVAHGTATTRRPTTSGDDRPATVVRRNTDVANEIKQHGLDLPHVGVTSAANTR